LLVAGLLPAASAWSIGPRPSKRAPLVPVAATGAQLIMVEERGCQYCLKWNRDVGRVYARTSEGRFAPLRRVGRDAAVLKPFAPVIYTPTFILTRNGSEVARITGYPGEPYFWEELGVMLRAIGHMTAEPDKS
jgi:hypothetical protein